MLDWERGRVLRFLEELTPEQVDGLEDRLASEPQILLIRRRLKLVDGEDVDVRIALNRAKSSRLQLPSG